MDEGLGNIIIMSLEGGIKGSFLSVDSGFVGSSGSLVCWSVFVISSSKSSRSIGLGLSSSSISSSGISSSRSGSSMNILGIVHGNGSSVHVLGLGSSVGLGSLEGWLIECVGKFVDLASNFTAVILGLLLEKNSRGISEEESSNSERCEFHL